MTTQLFGNNARASLSASITNVATSITVGTGQGALFSTPTGGDFELLTIYAGTQLRAGDAYEIVKLTARSTDTLTVVRAQEGTAAVAWAARDTIAAHITAGTLGRLAQNNATTANSIAIGDNLFPGTIPEWQASHAYTAGDIIRSVGADRYTFACTTAGTSGGTEPAWNTALARDATNDGTAVFEYGAWIELADIARNISVGDGAKLLSKSVAIGESAQAYAESVSIGDNAKTWARGIAIGNDSRAHERSAAIGHSAVAGADNAIALGDLAATNGASSLAVGSGASVASGSDGSIAIGRDSHVGTSAPFCHAIGFAADNIIGSTTVINSINLLKKSAAILIPGYELVFAAGMQSIVMSDEINLKTIADDAVAITIPTGAKFFADELGLIITAASGVTGQPNVSFGITGDTVVMLASTAITGDALHERDAFAPLLKHGQSSLTASVKTAAIGTDLKGRFYWRGILIESE